MWEIIRINWSERGKVMVCIPEKRGERIRKFLIINAKPTRIVERENP